MVERTQYLERIQPFIDKPVIKIMTGIRRCGKTTLMQAIADLLVARGVHPSRMLQINFESFEGLRIVDAEGLIRHVQAFQAKQKQKTYLFMDEIQQVQGWERAINAFRVEYDTDIYLTGSNATMLSGQLATHLAGRYVSFLIQPFSFSEFAALFPQSGLSRDDMFMAYVNLGGMPFLQHFALQRDPSMEYLRDVYNTVVVRDIVANRNIRDVDLLDRLIRCVMANVGQPLSATSLSRYLKSEGRSVSVDTVLNYLSACVEAFLLTHVPEADVIGKRVLNVSGKYYLCDHGFREAMVGGNEAQIQLILENIVCQELIGRGYHLTTGRNRAREIDFVATRDGQVAYYQVCYLLAEQRTIDREFGAFSGIADNYPKFVLSMDKVNFSREGILHRNIVDFLLDK